MIYIYIFFAVALRPNVGHGLLILRFLDHTYDAPQLVGLLWMSDQLVAETSTSQHLQQTNIQYPGGIWTHDLSGRAATNLCLKPCGHWDWLMRPLVLSNMAMRKQLYSLSITLLQEVSPFVSKHWTFYSIRNWLQQHFWAIQKKTSQFQPSQEYSISDLGYSHWWIIICNTM
jgi:hypothetical protein